MNFLIPDERPELTELKITDEEIIKALEHCGSKHTDNYGKYSCLKCPLYEFKRDECSDDLHDFALDLINRQRTEIEEKSNKLREILPIVAELKAEALTEYVIELEKRLIAGGLGIAFVRSQMYKLLKEKTEGENE